MVELNKNILYHNCYGGVFLYPTKRILKNLNVRRNLKKLLIAAENGDAIAMEKFGIDFFRRVVNTNDAHCHGCNSNYKEKEDIDIFEGMLSAIFWFEKAVEHGKIDANYWIGETIDLYAYCGIGGQAYYPASFKEFLQSKKCRYMFKEVIESQKGYLYKIFQEESIFFWENVVFYEKAANVGCSSSAFRLGELYLNHWYRIYYDHVKNHGDSPSFDDLDKAQKYLYFAYQKNEPEVISLIFNVFNSLNSCS